MTENKRFTWNGTSDGVGSIMDNETEGYLSYSQCIPVLNALHEENECLKDKLCELGVSDVKCYGKKIDTGLEEWLDD